MTATGSDDSQPNDADTPQATAISPTGWEKVFASVQVSPKVVGALLLLLVSPIFMVLAQRRFPIPPRPKSHLLALQALSILVAQAIFVAVVGGGGNLDRALIALIAWQALGLVALLRAPSIEFETAYRDQVIRQEWFKDWAWQGATEYDIKQTQEQVDQLQMTVDALQGNVTPLITDPQIIFDVRGERDPSRGKLRVVAITVIGVDHWRQQQGPLPLHGNKSEIAVDPYEARKLAEHILQLLDDEDT